MENVTTKIKTLRKKRGLTQAQLAGLAKIGGGKSLISQYESGKVTPELDTLNRLASALGVTVAYLIRPGKEPACSTTKGKTRSVS